MNKTIEIVKNPKVFFFDTGMRNIVIDDFRRLADRPDGGAVLENTVFIECIKNGKNIKYWRTKQRQEVDFIIEGEGRTLSAFEVKMKYDSRDMKSLNLFVEKYSGARKTMLYFKKDTTSKDSGDSDASIKYPVYSV
jgi:hypothetical protein